MRILLLPNSLKGSLSARQTARVLHRTLESHHTLKSFLLSDGGDGFIDFFAALYPVAKRVRLSAQNAFGKTATTSYLWLPAQKTAVIETAQICGLGHAKKSDLNPLAATSFGVGQVIAHALTRGAKKIYVGLGGVACNDAGAGIAQALGALFLDKHGQQISTGAQPLSKLHRLELTALKRKLHDVKIYAIADVTNPLLGPLGSARVYGPQKGATAAQVRTLERALTVFARVVQQTTKRHIANTPSAAAAGGLCAGLYGLCGAQIILGSDFIQTHLPLDKWAKWADLIITSEGKLDTQTLYGKAPLAALSAAVRHKKPVLLICGQYDEKTLCRLPRNLQLRLLCLSDFAKSTSDSIAHASHYIRQGTKFGVI